MNIDEIDLKTCAFSVFKTIMLALTVTGGTLAVGLGSAVLLQDELLVPVLGHHAIRLLQDRGHP